ncbi:MAG: HAD family hydrolase [Deltaproteobacteria bacterium]|nr:HAD family hydrolase [Deltaproteobacteria bacterium]
MTRLFTHLRLTPDARRTLLESLVDRSAERIGGRAPLIVFDLDGTLLDNRPRVVAILHELAAHWRTRYPNAAELLAKATDEDIGYGIVDNLVRLGVDDPELHREGQKFWFDRFFIDDYLRHDQPLAGAVAFAKRCHDAGASLMYLTGRDLPKMSLGTLASLRDCGFPIGVVGTSLVTKPAFDIPDERFKREVAATLDRVGPVLAVFDNEPGNCNALLEAHPACLSVLIDTQHAPDPPPLRQGVTVIDTFET